MSQIEIRMCLWTTRCQKGQDRTAEGSNATAELPGSTSSAQMAIMRLSLSHRESAHVCVCVYMCLYLCVCLSACLSTCVYVSVSLCLCVYTCLCAHVCLYLNVSVCQYVCVYVFSTHN